MLVKFCCCFDLRYGWIAYAVILLVIRITLLPVLRLFFYGLPYLFWNLCMVGFMLMALHGAIKKESILLYPSIVLTIFEIVVSIVIGLVGSVMLTPYMVLYLIIVPGLLTYYTLTLYSLHAIFKHVDDYRTLPNPV